MNLPATALIPMGAIIIKDVDEAKGTTNFKLLDVPVLDVGLGTGLALAGMQVFYKCNAVGIEVCPRTFAGSVHYLNFLEKKLGYLPFRTLQGDALKIKHFGYGQIIYCWLKGSCPGLLKHLFEVFVKDKHAMYFVSQEATLAGNGIRMIRSFPGILMAIHVYGKPKEEIAITKFNEVNTVAPNHNGPANNIQNAFFDTKRIKYKGAAIKKKCTAHILKCLMASIE